MKKLLLTFAILLITQISVAQDAFKKDVEKYFELSGASKGYEKMISTMSANIPAEKQADFKKAMGVEIKKLEGKMVDYYMQKLTHEDVKAMIKFYESPAGKKMVEVGGSEDLIKIAEEWGSSLTEVIMQYMSY